MTEENLEATIASNPDRKDVPKDGHFKATPIYPDPKKRPSLRLDSNIIAWFRAPGPGYQTRMNAVLRAYMRHAGQTSQPKDQVNG